MDYIKRKLQFDLEVWIGDVDKPGRRVSFIAQPFDAR